jgi:hypothetical protein
MMSVTNARRRYGSDESRDENGSTFSTFSRKSNAAAPDRVDCTSKRPQREKDPMSHASQTKKEKHNRHKQHVEQLKGKHNPNPKSRLTQAHHCVRLATSLVVVCGPDLTAAPGRLVGVLDYFCPAVSLFAEPSIYAAYKIIHVWQNIHQVKNTSAAQRGVTD